MQAIPIHTDEPDARARPSDRAWRSKGRCNDGNGTLTSLFFSDELVDIARAKAICSKCAVVDVCLATAAARSDTWGVWGGQLFQNGAIVLAKRPRGRPPKRPRPELVVDEVPSPLFRSA